MNLPPPSFGDVALVAEYFTTPAGDEVEQTTKFLTTFAALTDPPFACTCIIAALPVTDKGEAYRKAVDVLDVTDPAVLVIAVTVLEVAFGVQGADTALWDDLSPDDPVAIRGCAAALIAAVGAVAASSRTTSVEVLTAMIN